MTQTPGSGNTHTRTRHRDIPWLWGGGGDTHTLIHSPPGRPSPAPAVEHASFSRPEIWRSQRGVGKGGSAQLPIVSMGIGIAILSLRPGNFSGWQILLKHHAGMFLQAPGHRHSTWPQRPQVSPLRGAGSHVLVAGPTGWMVSLAASADSFTLSGRVETTSFFAPSLFQSINVTWDLPHCWLLYSSNDDILSYYFSPSIANLPTFLRDTQFGLSRRLAAMLA